MMLHEESVVTLLSAILGSSALGGIGGWMAQKLKRYRNTVTSDDLKTIEEKLDHDYTRFADIDKIYSGDSSVSRVIIDDDYNNIDDPQYVDIDGYMAFESHSSDESPFIGGTHGTRNGAKYTGTKKSNGNVGRFARYHQKGIFLLVALLNLQRNNNDTIGSTIDTGYYGILAVTAGIRI